MSTFKMLRNAIREKIAEGYTLRKDYGSWYMGKDCAWQHWSFVIDTPEPPADAPVKKAKAEEHDIDEIWSCHVRLPYQSWSRYGSKPYLTR